MRIVRIVRPFLLLGLAGLFAAGLGFLSATALGVGAQAPSRTVTINVGERGATGATGPPGPAGPPGPPSAESCPTGFEFAHVVFNTPGGHTTIATCVET